MTRRTRRTLYKPKKTPVLRKSRSKPKNDFDEDQEPPSEETWATMAPYASFVGAYLIYI